MSNKNTPLFFLYKGVFLLRIKIVVYFNSDVQCGQRVALIAISEQQ